MKYFKKFKELFNLKVITKFSKQKSIENFKEENNSLLVNVKSNNKQKIIDYIFFAKIISSYAVVLLHVNNFWDFSEKNKKKWIVKNIYDAIFYYAVPFFVLCIGATLLDFNERYGLLEYNKRRFIKVFLPLLGWTLILYLYKVYILKNIPKESLYFSSIWNYFFQSKLYSIYNSLHVFLLTYMLIPLLVYIEKNKRIRIYTYYFFLLLLTQGFIPYIIGLFGNKIVWIYNLKIGYLIYIFAGYIINNYSFSGKAKIIIYILGILSTIIQLYGTMILTLRYNRIILLYKGYLNLPSVLQSCSFFLFVKEYYYLITKLINKKYIYKLGSVTIGPFFMHFTVMETVSRFKNFEKLISFNLLFHSFFIFSICIIISLILKKIPLFKILVP